MEPTLPAPHGSPEIAPLPPRQPELSVPLSPETQRPVERPAPQERKTGAGAGDTPTSSVPLPVIPLPPATSASPALPSDNQADDTPLVAADEDLIEKEWVDKAKKVIKDTKQDPYAQERAVSRLQADYLNKRYGKQIKLSDEV